MTWVRVPTAPGGKLDQDAGAIKRPASGSAVFLPAMRRFNWLVGSCMSGQLIGQTWPNTVSPDSDPRRIYHYPSANCEHVVVAALIERHPPIQQRASQSSGELTFTADDGGGDEAIYRSSDTTTGTWYEDSSHWALWVDVVDLADNSFQYHTVEWSNLLVRGLAVWELPRTRLELAAGTVALGNRIGTYAGLEHRRRITDNQYAGIYGLVNSAQTARDHNRRHFNWLIHENDAWTSVGTSQFGCDLGSIDLGMTAFGQPGYPTGFGFPHIGRRIHADDSVREYYVRLHCCGEYVGGGEAPGGNTYEIQVASNADSVAFAEPGAWATLSPTADAKLEIDCTAADSIKIQGNGTVSGYAVKAAGLSLVESS